MCIGCNFCGYGDVCFFMYFFFYLGYYIGSIYVVVDVVLGDVEIGFVNIGIFELGVVVCQDFLYFGSFCVIFVEIEWK